MTYTAGGPKYDDSHFCFPKIYAQATNLTLCKVDIASINRNFT